MLYLTQYLAQRASRDAQVCGPLMLVPLTIWRDTHVCAPTGGGDKRGRAQRKQVKAKGSKKKQKWRV